MTKRLVLGTVAGGLAFFAWGAIYHMALPFTNEAMHSFANEDDVTRAIRAGATGAGTYAVPNVPIGATSEQRRQAMASVEEKAQRGPMMVAFVRPGPLGSFGYLLATQFLADLSLGLVATLLLLRAKPDGVLGRVLLLAVVGLGVWLASSVPQWNWYAAGTDWTLAELGEHVGGWALAGLALARVVPRS